MLKGPSVNCVSLWGQRTLWPTSRSLGERVEGRVGRKEQVDFPTGRVWCSQPPLMAPWAQMCPSHYNHIGSSPPQFYAPGALK